MSTANDKASIVIRETATDWAARLAAPDLAHAEKVAFAAWLRTSPVHIREYLNAEAIRLTVKAALQSDTTDVQTLLCQQQTNVVEWDAAPALSKAKKSRRVASLPRMAAAVAALLVGGATLGGFFYGHFSSNAYSTDIGEIRRIALPDGFTVELNTHSKIRVDFEADQHHHPSWPEAKLSLPWLRIRIVRFAC